MGQPKGKTGNPNGRPKGTPNKVTKELRERFKDFTENNFDSIQSWLDRVASKDPAEAARLYLAFSERVIGKISNASIDITSGGSPLKQPVLNILPAKPEPEAE